MRKGKSYCTITPDPRFPDIGIERFHHSLLRAKQASKEIREKDDDVSIYLVPKTGKYFVGTKKEFESIHWSFRVERKNGKVYIPGFRGYREH
tara:strand:- start:188 stop:463 length:276 start_codon:yes stop_codon:yes gene_type:complete